MYVPVSRQQAGIDFVIVRGDQFLRAQVKSSRHYEWVESPILRFWYTKFAYHPNGADLFFFFGLYPQFKKGKKVSDRHLHWQKLILVFSDAEIGKIIKRQGGDRFLQFGIDPVTPSEKLVVRGTRGGVMGETLTTHLLENRTSWLRNQFRDRK